MPYFIETSYTPRYNPWLKTDPDPIPGIERLKAEGVKLISMGVDLDVLPDVFPNSGRDFRGIKTMPDVVGAGYWWAFSAELRNIIEAFEFNMHQFSKEYIVYYKDGRRAEKTYYCINIKPQVRNSVIWEKSKIKSIGQLTGFDDDLVFDEAIIGSRHLWRAPDLGRICMSDELQKAVKKAKIKDFRYQHELMGRR